MQKSVFEQTILIHEIYNHIKHYVQTLYHKSFMQIRDGQAGNALKILSEMDGPSDA